MALITAISAGDVNVAANWSPAQVPTATDDVVIDGLVMTVPVGYSFQPQSLVLKGQSASARGTLSVSGTYVASGGCSLEPFNELRLNAAGVLDLAGGSVLATNSSTSSTQPNFLNFTGASTDWCQIIDSVGGGKIQRDNGDRVTGPLTMKNCQIKGLDDYAFKAGGSYYAGGHVDIDGVVFRNSGVFEIGGYVNTSDNFTVRRFEVRGTTSSVTDTQIVVGRIITNALIGDGSGVFNCERWVLDSENNTTQAKISLRYANVYDLKNIVTDGVLVERILGSNVQQNIDNSFFHFTTTTGGGGITSGSGCTITNSYVFTTRDNPHTAGGALFDASIIEATYADAATDAGDHFIVPGSSDLTVSNSLILDGLGGVLLNALGSAASGNYAARHNTVISDVPNDTGRIYGHLARDENGGTFAGTLNLHDNLVAVRSNPNGYTDIRAINLDTVGVDDQITAMDNNAYFGYATDAATLYFGVTSASKTVGDPGYGGNDVIGVDPQFVDGTRSFERYATEVLGLADLSAALDYVKGINGYDSATELLDVNSESGFDVAALKSWVLDGYAPTNSAYDGAASDGGTIGAVLFAAPPVIDAAVSFARTVAESQTAAADVGAGVVFSRSLSDSDLAKMDAISAVSSQLSLASGEVAAAVAQSGVSSSVALSFLSALDSGVLASASFGVALSVSSVESAVSLASASYSVALSVAQQTGSFVAAASILEALALTSTANPTAVANGALLSSVSLLDAVTAGRAIADSVAFAIQNGVTQDGLQAIGAAVSSLLNLSESSASQVDAATSAEFRKALVVSALALAAQEAGVNFGTGFSVSSQAGIIVVGIRTPDWRTINVEIDTRENVTAARRVIVIEGD